MLHKTRGIVLSVTDYSESSIVAKIYTENFGPQSFLVNSVRKKNSRVKGNLFEPLTLLDLVIYHKENRGLQRISEIKANPVFLTIPYDIKKATVIIFLAEMLYKSIREEEANPSMFSFIEESVLFMDREENPGSLFHAWFLLKLTRYLGFYPNENYSPGYYFNLREGVFEPFEPPHPHFLGKEQSIVLARLLAMPASSVAEAKLPVSDRKRLLYSLVEYYNLHIPAFGEVKSLAVLEEVFQ